MGPTHVDGNGRSVLSDNHATRQGLNSFELMGAIAGAVPVAIIGAIIGLLGGTGQEPTEQVNSTNDAVRKNRCTPMQWSFPYAFAQAAYFRQEHRGGGPKRRQRESRKTALSI